MYKPFWQDPWAKYLQMLEITHLSQLSICPHSNFKVDHLMWSDTVQTPLGMLVCCCCCLSSQNLFSLCKHLLWLNCMAYQMKDTHLNTLWLLTWEQPNTRLSKQGLIATLICQRELGFYGCVWLWWSGVLFVQFYLEKAHYPWIKGVWYVYAWR